jgi:hypothetical protein
MKGSRLVVVIVLLAAVSFVFTSSGSSAPQPKRLRQTELFYPSLVAEYHTSYSVEPALAESYAEDRGGGIKEEIPAKYLVRFQEWKKEFLSTEFGRKQWDLYENNPQLTLTISVSRENAEGATTGKYKWNGAGKLVAATIVLGLNLNEGYPNPIYFPVMNSLVPTGTSYRVGGNTLAATKLAHEFGHVNRTASADPTLYQLQSKLIPEYNEIFLTSGRNPNDPRLLELARRIGGTPVEIWEDREYWGEANAMLYLRDRFTEENLRCSLFSKIRHRVDLYAKHYEGRFLEIAQSTSSKSNCGW